MADTAHLPFHAITFRCGWDQKTMHTIFDYVVRSLKNDLMAGKTIAGWTLQLCGEIMGGYAPMLEDISTEKEKVPAFVELLLGHQEHFDTEVKNLLVASVLRFHNQFLELLEMDPNGRFIEPTKHRFALKVRQVANDAGEYIVPF